MDLTFLRANQPLTKTYTLTPDGIEKTPYPMTWEFTSTKESVSTLKQFESALRKHAADASCLLKGNIARPLVNESRAGATDANDATEWLVLDFDGLPETVKLEDTQKQTVETAVTLPLVMQMLGLDGISYIVQWSASYGISDNKIRAHVFMMLDRPYAAPLLKQWLIQKNHTVALFADSMELTKTGNSIRWPLDISACQNDKLIYIAPPVLNGIDDPMGKKPRIGYVKKEHEFLSLVSDINSAEKNKKLTQDKINALREKRGLEKRKFNFKVVGGSEVMLKPDESIITDMKVERGFVYFNLNGGDSWAYYHPENKPEFIFNFKGEPTYLTKELLPEYWASLNQNIVRTDSSGVTYLAFCDRRTGTYWRGTYNNVSDLLDIYQAKNETQLRDFCKQHGLPIGDFIPEWDLIFNPADNIRIDGDNRVINRFTPSKYMRATAKKVTKCPPTIFKVMHHALGNDVETTEHFVNWLAYILQERDRTKTAWVLHGTQGTGKGILTNNILRPLFTPHTSSRRMEELGEKYNHFMSDSLLVFVDEVQIKALGNEQGIMAKLKNFITEEIVPVRMMHSNALEMRNYSNWIFMSNMPDPVSINKGDRRFNVGRYQSERLELADAELQSIERELQPFHDYLLNYVVDKDKVRQVNQSVDRSNMIAVSESSLDTVADALLEGNFEYLLDMLPSNDMMASRNNLTFVKYGDYVKVLKTLMHRTKEDGRCNVSRDELHVIFDYLSDRIPQSPNKFTALLKHHRIHTTKVWISNKTMNGIAVHWRDFDQFAEYSKNFFAKGDEKVK